MGTVITRTLESTLATPEVSQYMHTCTVHTKVLLCPPPVKVDPDLPWSIIADTGIFLIVETIESTTHCIVEL